MDNTITLQGNFVSNGKRVDLNVPCGVDWIRVYNMTALNQGTADLGYEFYFQKNMTSGSGIGWVKLGSTDANNSVTVGQLAVGSGFVPLNQGYSSGISSQVRDSIRLSSPVAFSAISNATQPVVTTASTAGLQAGDVVYLSQTAGNIDDAALLGIPFQVDTIVSNTSFRIANALDQAPGNAGTDGFWRRVVVGNTFYPELRYIVAITTSGSVGALTASALQPVIVTSVDSGYLVGQEVTFNVPNAVNGMVEINSLSAPIIAVDPATPSIFQVSLDTTGFTPFVFPDNAELSLINNEYTPAHVVPAGMNTAVALAAIPVVDILSDATVNQLIMGVTLLGGNATPGGSAGPAGASGDVMFWQAGAVYSTNGM